MSYKDTNNKTGYRNMQGNNFLYGNLKLLNVSELTAALSDGITEWTAPAPTPPTDAEQLATNKTGKKNAIESDFLVESKRYVDASERGFVTPNVSDKVKCIIDQAYIDARETYIELIEMGVPKEDARSILPMNTMTSMYIAGNLQAWMDMFKLRVSKHAQKEIRDVAITCWALLIEVYPLIFTDLIFEDKNFEEWSQDEPKIKD